MNRELLITGGAGFIGSHVIRRFVTNYPNYHVVNLDNLTYAGNLENLSDLESASNYTFEKGDICDNEFVISLFDKYNFDSVIHLAAESHVDRSILNPIAFIQTNIVGTTVLLNAAKSSWGEDFNNKLFYHVSTDEVYGSLGKSGLFTETTPYDPKSPYSASKASSDHLVRAYGNTFGLPFVISNCSNNYGPNQFPEKLIPLMIRNILDQNPLPVYGKGDNIRDWLYVKDHASAIDAIFHQGKVGDTYNIGGKNEWRNIDLVELLCDLMDEQLNQDQGTNRKLITFVKDRAGHDLRYAIDSSKLEREIGWKPSLQFREGLSITIEWYLKNKSWMEHIINKDYLKYYEDQYKTR